MNLLGGAGPYTHLEDPTPLPFLNSLFTPNDQPCFAEDDTANDVGGSIQQSTSPKKIPLHNICFHTPNTAFYIIKNEYSMVEGDFKFMYHDEVHGIAINNIQRILILMTC